MSVRRLTCLGTGTAAARRLAGLLLMAALLVSCSVLPIRSDRPKGIYHRVKGGETLSMIARAYQVNLQDLAETNNISNPDQIAVGSVLFIPDVTQIVDDVLTAARSEAVRLTPPPAARPAPSPPAPVAAAPSAKAPPSPAAAAPPAKAPPGPVATPKATEKREAAVEAAKPPVRQPAVAERKQQGVPPREVEPEAAPRIPPRPQASAGESRLDKPREADPKQDGLQFDKERFGWPVKGTVVSRFGIQPNGMYLNGIRIAAGEGAVVQAAAAGVVIFSATLKDYGETIIIKHDDQYATVYTHLGTRTVRSDARVKRGERIAFLGPAGGQGEPYLHFEIRQQAKPRNPLFFLP